MMSIDKRQFFRFSISLRASLQFTDSNKITQHIDFKTKNISSGGLFFQSKTLIDVNTDAYVEIMMTVPDSYEPTMYKEIVSTTGKVIRHDKEGIAIAFDKHLLEIEQNLRLVDIYLLRNFTNTATRSDVVSTRPMVSSKQLNAC